MYHRHTTSSNGGAPPQHQQPYQFQRARSVGARPQPILNTSYDGSSARDTSYSSLPDNNQNYYGNSNSNANESNYYDNKYKKRNSSSSRSRSTGSLPLQSFLVWRVLPCLILIILPWIPNYFVRNQVRAKKLEIQTIVQEQKDLVQSLDDTTEKIKNLKMEVESLHKDNELSFQELKHNGKTPENLAAGEGSDTQGSSITDMESDEYSEMEQDEEVLMNRIDRLEKEIQKNAVKRLTERYGNGRYRFKVNVKDQRGASKFFVIETALLAEMPHAIDHFHRMVEKQLWDGLALVHEPDSNIISATPMMTDETHTWAGKRFVDANLTHMAFTEHSQTYPPPHHRKFSVAFSGRPGGPGFYISLENELEFAHERESTFGVVMEGRDLLFQLFLQKNRGMQKILTIESINILPPRKVREEKS